MEVPAIAVSFPLPLLPPLSPTAPREGYWVWVRAHGMLGIRVVYVCVCVYISPRYHWLTASSGDSEDCLWNWRWIYTVLYITHFFFPSCFDPWPASYSQKLLVFDALCGTFRTIKLRPRQTQCSVCGDNPSITALIDYELFCGSRADDKVAPTLIAVMCVMCWDSILGAEPAAVGP